MHAIYTPHSSIIRAHFKVKENSSTQITMKFVKIITAAFLAANTFVGEFDFYPSVPMMLFDMLDASPVLCGVYCI